MIKRSVLIYAGVLCLVCAWGLLFAGFLQEMEWARATPAWTYIVLLVAAGAATAASGRTRRTRGGLLFAVVLTAAALISVHISKRETAGLEESWWRSESEHLTSTLLAAGQEISRLETVSKTVGAHVSEYLDDRGFDKDGRTQLNRNDVFSFLDSLVAATTKSGALPTDAVIGIQLFDSSGERFAWSGWPRAIGALDRNYMLSGVELVYSREVALYRILTHQFPVGTRDNGPAWVVVVDMPLEVNYRVNNRFLKSAGLADNIRTGNVASISFEYSPVLSNLPYRLERFKRVQRQNYERRQRMIEARKRGKRRVPTDAGDETGGADGRRRSVTREDSVLTYYPFPGYIEPISEISGDKATGLLGRVLIRSPQGNPLVTVTANGFPFRHYADQYRSLWLGRAKALIVLALLTLFVVSMLALDRRGYHAWLRGVVFVGFIVLLRYSLLSFQSFSAGEGRLIFDPTVFATPILGGIMRSAGDLLITGVLFVITLYGLMKMIRSQTAGRPDTRAGNSGRRPRSWEFAAKGVVFAAVLLGVYVVARAFVGAVVINANPRLIGETMRITDASVLVLHLGLFLTVTGIVLTGMLFMWGLCRLTGWSDATRAAWVALGLTAVIAFARGPWELLPIGVLLIAFVILAPRYVQREDLVSIAVVSFCLVIITSGMSYLFLNRNYNGLRKNFIREKADEQVVPSDNWKVVILEDVLDEYSHKPEIRNAFRNPRSPDAQRLAFDLWAEGPLSLLGYSCAIHVVTNRDSVISGFAVDMPYRVRIEQGGERIDTPVEDDWVVLDLTRNTPQGIVRYYRGVVNVEEEHSYVYGSELGGLAGKVVVDLPYFFGSLEWAARTGPRTPELLRNVQEGGVSPRVEEPEALLLARLDGNRIYESSSEILPVGVTVDEDLMKEALAGNWPLLDTGSGGLRVLIRETGEADKYLLAGFAVSSPARHLLRWSTLFSLDMLFMAMIIVATVLLGSIPYLKELLPTLTPGRKLGFQQKLLASFLVVALVPAVILGLFSVDFIKDRFVEENRQEALDKLFSARKALVNLLQGEMQLFFAQGDPGRVFTDSSYAGEAAAGAGARLVKVFDESGDSGVLALDKTGRPLERPDSLVPELTVDLADASAEDLYIVYDDGAWYIGVLSPPMVVSGEDWSERLYLYYARRLDASLLGDIADQVSGDVNVYDAGGALIASSQEGLLAGGLISAIIDSDAYVKISLLGSNHSLATERTGTYRYQVAYLPVTTWKSAGGEGPARAAMSVPLVFLPESYSLEIQKATSIVLGIFALLFMATIGLGLLLARGIFEPLRSLLEGTRRIIGGDLNVRLPMRRSDEIGIVVSAFNEMTAQLSQSQRDLDERRRYLETILDNIGTGVISTDARNRIQTVNRAAERILGIESRQAVGRTAAEMTDAGRASGIFRILHEGHEAREAFVASEVELQHDGRRSTVKYMLTRLSVEDRDLGMVFVFEDLTELIQSKKLSAWVEMARQIAHEIKNPLTPIRISTQFMQRAYAQKSDKFDQIFREGSETIIQQVDVLKRIASEFSSYGRMQQLAMGRHRLTPLLDNIIRPYLNNPAGVTVEFHNSSPEAVVVTDPEALRKICTNLVENAMDAMPNGGKLGVTCTHEDIGKVRFVRVSFQDTGPGLSSEAADKLFEPYFSTKTTGTGLGLAICRSLSQEMGGDIEVSNVPEGGVKASVLLRCQD